MRLSNSLLTFSISIFIIPEEMFWNSPEDIEMGEEGLLEKANPIFASLINLTNEELTSKGFTVAPSLIIEKIVSPVKELYIKNLAELLESLLRTK
jgi:hypothetical protein